MKNFNLILLLGGTIFVGSGCKYFQSKPVEVIVPLTDGTYCFMSALNKDTTRISLSVKGDKVEGTKVWRPFEKDGAIGTLKGTRSGNTLNTVYSYTIEGSKQSETIRFMLNGDKLTQAKGELEDLKSNGNMTYKDTTKITFEGGDLLLKADCPPPVKAAAKSKAKAKTHAKGKKHK
jgi:hypothetical protein